MWRLLVPNLNKNHSLISNSTLGLILVIIFLGNILLSSVGVVTLKAAVNIYDLYDLQNQERIKNNLPPLKVNQLLINSATAKAHAMLDSNCWSHYCPNGKSPWDFFNDVKYDYIYAGENLAEGFVDNQTLITAWMNSPSHKENILNPNFEEIGIGYAQGTFQNIKNNTVIAVHFGKSALSLTQNPDVLPVSTDNLDIIPPQLANDDFTVSKILIDNIEYYIVVLKNADVDKLTIDNNIIPDKINFDSWQFRLNVSDASNLFALNLKAYDKSNNESKFELPISLIAQKAIQQNSVIQTNDTNFVNTMFSELTQNPKIQLNLSFAVILSFLFGMDFYILEKTGKTNLYNNNRQLFLIMLIVFLLLLSLAGFGGQILDGINY